jgi:hypothetical protein
MKAEVKEEVNVMWRRWTYPDGTNFKDEEKGLQSKEWGNAWKQILS